ncbi:MAG TPA: enoyl-CoA hydratase-related protein, partial [Anaerolineae bacterium]
MTNVILETSNGVTKISLNKPPLNVIDIALMQELSAALDRIGPESKVVIIGAQGKLFSAGVDIKDHTPDRVG